MLIDKDKLIERIKFNFSPTEKYSMQSLINAINDYSQGIEVVRYKDNKRNDIISRAELIESFLGYCDCKRDEADAWTCRLDLMLELIDDAPSVVPSKNLINRQDALDAIANFVPYVIDDISTESYTNGLKDAYNLIYQLPIGESEEE